MGFERERVFFPFLIFHFFEEEEREKKKPFSLSRFAPPSLSASLCSKPEEPSPNAHHVVVPVDARLAAKVKKKRTREREKKRCPRWSSSSPPKCSLTPINLLSPSPSPSSSLSFSLFFNKEMELSLVGLQNAGKTSLVGVLATGAFQEVREGGIEREFFFLHIIIGGQRTKNERKKNEYSQPRPSSSSTFPKTTTPPNPTTPTGHDPHRGI